MLGMAMSNSLHSTWKVEAMNYDEEAEKIMLEVIRGYDFQYGEWEDRGTIKSLVLLSLKRAAEDMRERCYQLAHGNGDYLTSAAIARLEVK